MAGAKVTKQNESEIWKEHCARKVTTERSRRKRVQGR